MKKRLGKKKHLGEFTEWGSQVIITRNTKDNGDEFLDAFIEEAIEANGCYCGGGGHEDQWEFVIELGIAARNPDAKVAAISAWLDARPDVAKYEFGEPFDLWHSEWPE